MAATNVFNETWASLQKQLDLVAHFLLGSLSLAYRPRLVLKDAETASTDGQYVVKMPRNFLGVGLEDGRPEIFLGLLAHEVGHWLQPVKEIKAVEKETGLMHDFVNIVLDVHCEHQAGLIFPLFKRPIKAVRELVGDNLARRYRREFRKAEDFVTAAMAALLYSRYCVRPDESFHVAAIGFQRGALAPRPKAAYDLGRLEISAERGGSGSRARFRRAARRPGRFCGQLPRAVLPEAGSPLRGSHGRRGRWRG